ncbi:MAG: 2-oxo acid dehydrogenase subunit E2 [Sphaerochaetaceae bacterium]|nr:2-oxo acid dehydrogenase subunit E2 [Sphaerochaetaceae bacterium]
MRRNDATLVVDVPQYRRIIPHIMKRRCDALVYQTVEIDLTKTVQFVRQQNRLHPQDHPYRVFEVFIAAIMRTIALRPEVNRFVARYQYWQRNELSLNFVIKEDYTDEAPEHSTPIVMKPDMTLPEMALIINKTIEEARKPANENFTDEAIGFFLHFPLWIVRMVVNLARFLDHMGKAPTALRDADGLHTSVFISNLGSIGLAGGSPHHHLYEWGTTSMFVTMGTLRRNRLRNGEKTTFTDTMEVGFTVDERVTDGFYFTNTIRTFQDLLNNPEKLLERPTLPPPPKTKKQWKLEQKEKKQADRAAKKLAKKSA